MTHDVIVVGSGFAGGVTAARLAERGMRVLVLERGVWRGPAGRQYVVHNRDRQARVERHAVAPRDRHGTLPNISPALGRGFSANGDAIAMAWHTRRLSRSNYGLRRLGAHYCATRRWWVMARS